LPAICEIWHDLDRGTLNRHSVGLLSEWGIVRNDSAWQAGAVIFDSEAAAQPSDSVGADVDAQVTLRALATQCVTGECPTVYLSDRDTVVVQGYPLAPGAARIAIPDGEGLIEIPLSLLTLAARNLGGS
jgi:hypothetical protein